MLQDDIAALSTPPGEGGIAIVRLSGPGVIARVSRMFVPYRNTPLERRPGFSLSLGWIVDRDGSKVDQVLIGLMRAPHSYTGEDVIEINCHGGSLPARRCLQRCVEEGARLAEPGEYTKRAFLNGRLDLSQAEAVMDIIKAKTDRGLKLAMQQLEGNLGCLERLEDQLLHLNAMVEASLDFPEEVGDIDYDEAAAILTRVRREMDQIIAAGQRNEIYLEGIKVVICGKPNVGKSSLLNALARKDKAIVTEIPGTTRDVVEEFINVRGIPVKLMDTAGIRITDDLVEKIGVEKSKAVIEEADLLVFMVDVAEGINQEDLEILGILDRKRLIVLVNKEDLEQKRISETELAELFAGLKIIRTSLVNEMGLEELEQAIEEMVCGGAVPGDGLDIMINLRQKEALLRSRGQVDNALQNLGIVTPDCLGVDVWGALETLGEISGKTLKEEVIDRIFRDFCIGK